MSRKKRAPGKGFEEDPIFKLMEILRNESNKGKKQNYIAHIAQLVERGFSKPNGHRFESYYVFKNLIKNKYEGKGKKCRIYFK